MNRAKFVAVLLVALICAAATADVFVEKISKTFGTEKSGEEQEWLTKMWLSDKAIRIEEPDSDTVHITDFAKQQLITLDAKNKEYFIIPLEQVNRDFVKATENLAKNMSMNWRMENFPATESIAGYDCQKIKFYGFGEVNLNGRKSEMKITMTFWINKELATDTLAADRIIEVMGLDKHPFIGTEILDELKRIGGFHMKANILSVLDGREQGVEQTVNILQKVEHDPTVYEIPAGYTEVSSPLTR